MRTLNVDVSDRSYPVMVGPDLLSRAGELLVKRGWNTPPIIVTNRTVFRLHGDPLVRSLEDAFGTPHIISIRDGERFKTHDTLMQIYSGMFRARADRRSWILAFGGGVVGDIAGFAAATFMRGIRFVMVPTTLLAQIDSSVGGKVAINLPQGKNLVGAFHQPAAVLTDTNALGTLSERELASGLYEIVKHAAIRSKSLLRYLETRLPNILARRSGELVHIIVESVKIKSGVVSMDEKEENLRMILNFGHTVGHALETATDYRRYKHGEAVAWGMIAALGFGKRLGFLQSEDAARLIDLIFRVGPLPGLKGIHFTQLWNALARDKKFRSGNILMVLLSSLGDAEIQTSIEPETLRRFLKKFLATNGDPTLIKGLS